MKKILVIANSKDIRQLTAEILELANYSVITADNGRDGVEQVFREKPDLIICDAQMPLLDGYGVLHLLHKSPEVRNTPFIFLASRADRPAMRKAMELGADDYITTPFNETELLQAVESRLKKVALLKEDLLRDINNANIYPSNEKEVLKAFTDGRDTFKYRRRQIIYAEGSHPTRLYYVQKGKVKTYKSNDEGKELIISLYNEGDFLGYVALLEGTTYKETCEALEPVELAVIPKADFEELLNTSREVSRNFFALLAHAFSEQEQHLVGLAYNSLRKKVAETLIALHRVYKSSITISRVNLAHMAGTATESMIRTLYDFRDEQLIEVHEGSIIILNERKLEAMAN